MLFEVRKKCNGISWFFSLHSSPVLHGTIARTIIHSGLLRLYLDQDSLGDYITVSPWLLGSLSTPLILPTLVLIFFPRTLLDTAVKPRFIVFHPVVFTPKWKLFSVSCFCNWFGPLTLWVTARCSGYGRQGHWFWNGWLSQRCKGGKETGWVWTPETLLPSITELVWG